MASMAVDINRAPEILAAAKTPTAMGGVSVEKTAK